MEHLWTGSGYMPINDMVSRKRNKKLKFNTM